MNLYLGGLHMTQNLGCDVVQAKFHKHKIQIVKWNELQAMRQT